MDNPQLGPRLSSYRRTFATPAVANGTTAPVRSDMPMVSTIQQGAYGLHRPFVPHVDFNESAKMYRRSMRKYRIGKILIVFGISIVIIAVLLGAIGYALNQRYAGRALPYTYIGPISVGGLTQPQIKAALDSRASELEVTFTEGGLTRTVPASVFGAEFDTQKASESAITGFNPFSYLTKRSLSVPVSVNERYVDAYLRMNVADKQTDAKNAEIVKVKKDLVIVPETYGFRSSTSYITEQLTEQLPKMDDPVINLSSTTDKPSITKADLQDDIETARRLINTNVGLKIGTEIVKPTEDQKLAWLEITQELGSNQVKMQFSEAKIREFVQQVVTKYSVTVENEQLITNPDGTVSVKPGKNGLSVTNAEEVAYSLRQALNNQQSIDIAFAVLTAEYQKVDRALVTPTPQQPTQEAQASIPSPTANL